MNCAKIVKYVKVTRLPLILQLCKYRPPANKSLLVYRIADHKNALSKICPPPYSSVEMMSKTRIIPTTNREPISISLLCKLEF